MIQSHKILLSNYNAARNQPNKGYYGEMKSSNEIRNNSQIRKWHMEKKVTLGWGLN